MELSTNVSVDGDAKRDELGKLDTAQLVEMGAKEMEFFLINLAFEKLVFTSSVTYKQAFK